MKQLLFNTLCILTLLVACNGGGSENKTETLLQEKTIPLPADLSSRFKDGTEKIISDTIRSGKSYARVEATILTKNNSGFITHVRIFGRPDAKTKMTGTINEIPINTSTGNDFSMGIRGSVTYENSSLIKAGFDTKEFIVHSSGTVSTDPLITKNTQLESGIPPSFDDILKSINNSPTYQNAKKTNSRTDVSAAMNYVMDTSGITAIFNAPGKLTNHTYGDFNNGLLKIQEQLKDAKVSKTDIQNSIIFLQNIVKSMKISGGIPKEIIDFLANVDSLVVNLVQPVRI